MTHSCSVIIQHQEQSLLKRNISVDVDIPKLNLYKQEHTIGIDSNVLGLINHVEKSHHE